MTLVYETDAGARAYTKGAPELLDIENAGDLTVLDAAGAWAQEGLRVLAIAERPLLAGDRSAQEIEAGLHLLGIVAFHDPLRATSLAAVGDARAAGIQVRMVTGDHPATARTIGRALGLVDDEIVHA